MVSVFCSIFLTIDNSMYLSCERLAASKAFDSRFSNKAVMLGASMKIYSSHYYAFLTGVQKVKLTVFLNLV